MASVGLSLEMRRSSGVKKLESLRAKRGKAVADNDHEAYLILSRSIATTQADMAAIDEAISEAKTEAARREAIEAPKREREAPGVVHDDATFLVAAGGISGARSFLGSTATGGEDA